LNFAGYHTPRPNDDRSDYRNIGNVRLHTSREVIAVSGDEDRRGSGAMMAMTMMTMITTIH